MSHDWHLARHVSIIFLGNSEKFVSAGFMRKYIHIARALKVR